MIHIKAQQTLVKFNKTDAGTLLYVMRPETYSQLAESKVIEEAALRSGVSQLSVGLWFLISPRLRQNLTRNP